MNISSRYAVRLRWGTLGLALLAAAPAPAADHLDRSRVIAQVPQTTTDRFTFVLSEKGPAPCFDFEIRMTQGRAGLRVVDPAGRERRNMSARQYTGRDCPIVSPKTATPPGSGLANAGLMILVGAVFAVFWRRRSGVSWAWFWAGAGLWLVAVLVKFSIAALFNRPVFQGLKAILPNWAYLAAGTAYGGVLTGITEILFVLIAARIWNPLAATPGRAVAVGVGAGSFEAAMLGLGAAAMVVIGGMEAATPAGTYAVEVTATEAVGEWHLRIHDAPAGPAAPREDASISAWSRALVGPVERTIAILCHVGSRVLVLLAVARRRWALFWAGFLLLSGVDALATFFWISGQVRTMSPWLMEALLAPFGIVSIPVTIACMRRWPGDPGVMPQS